MTSDARPVNGSLLNATPKTYLTLSAVEDVSQPRDRSLTVPPEAAVRDERDPMTAELMREGLHAITELELRALWGDR